jgi:hypothetical protein
MLNETSGPVHHDDAFRGNGPDHRRLLVSINRAKHHAIGLERDRLV